MLNMCLISAFHHIHVVQSLHHVLIHFASYRHHVHKIQIFHNKNTDIQIIRENFIAYKEF